MFAIWRLRQRLAVVGVGFNGHIAPRKTLTPHVRFGSKADIATSSSNVRFTLKSGHRTRCYTRGVAPAKTVCIHARSMFCPVRMTAARRPCRSARSFISAANAAAPAPSAQLWVAL